MWWIWGNAVALACRCLPSDASVADHLAGADAVFEGQVVEVGVDFAELAVFAAWKGVDGPGRLRLATVAPTACGFGFERGDVVLVFAHREGGGPLRDIPCGRTARSRLGVPSPTRTGLGAPSWQQLEAMPPAWRFHEALRAGDLAVASQIARAGIDVDRLPMEALAREALSACDADRVRLLREIEPGRTWTAPLSVFTCDPEALDALRAALPEARAWQLLHRSAVDKERSDVVARLLAWGVPAEPMGDPSSRSPLEHALWAGKTAIARQLADGGALVTPRAALLAGDDPALAWVAERMTVRPEGLCRALLDANDAGRVARLVDLGLEPSPCAEGTMTFARDLESVDRLRSAGFRLDDARPEDRYTLLHLAAAGADLVMVRGLLERGAPIEARGHFDATPLHRAANAAGGGAELVVDALLDAGADPDARQSDGSTALHVAVWSGRVEVVERLPAAGARTDLLGGEGGRRVTPLRLARDRGATRSEALLHAHGAPLGGVD